MKREGFTLIEIMVVIGVLGFLCGLAAIVVTGSVGESKVKQAQTELEMISTAILQLAWDTGRYPNRALRTKPGSTEVWDLRLASSGLLSNFKDAYPNWNGPYYEDELIDPWGTPYFFDPDYRVNGVMRPVVGSFGPNKKGPNLYDKDDIYIRLDD